jgi:hypothetical protein
MLSVVNKPFMLCVVMLICVMLIVTNNPFMLSVANKPFMLSVTKKLFMLSVVMLRVLYIECHKQVSFMLSVVMLRVIILKVVAQWLVPGMGKTVFLKKILFFLCLSVIH